MILNHQHQVRIPVKHLEKFLARAQRELDLPADSLDVCLVTDAQMARWNRDYRGKRGPTDVLSFPVNGDAERRSSATQKIHQSSRKRRPPPFSFVPPTSAYLGDIAIAPAVARRNARRFGRTFEDEMRILILHGILHLMGYNHETDAGQMDRREHRLRRTLGLA